MTAAAAVAAAISHGPPAGFQPHAGATAAAVKGYGDLPLAFEPSAGRFPAGTDFVSRAGGGTVALGDRGLEFTQDTSRRAGDTIALGLPGAHLAHPTGLAKLPGVVNDLRGNDESKWTTGIPTFSRVGYRNAYPGTDLAVHGRDGKPEYDFRLAPGADPSRIALDFRGADSVQLTPKGDLVIRKGQAVFRNRMPVAYQPTAGGRAPVKASFALRGHVARFALGPYDHSRPLVIDPLVLDYSTYLGGSLDDFFNDVAVDSSGAAYAFGATSSTDFDTVGPIEGDSPGPDLVVSKLNPAGSALVYSTYLGGSGNDFARQIAVDSSGAAYITGFTDSSDFDKTAGAYDESYAGGDDGFVSKLNPAGSGLVYSTYIGGSGFEQSNAIAVDSAGSAYVTGVTLSTDFDTKGQIEGDSPANDAFVAKLNPAGSALRYSTYLGGNADDYGGRIAVDSSGSAYVEGGTVSTDYNLVGAIEGNSPGTDLFVSKLNPAGSALVYSTYLGGDGDDEPNGIGLDSTGAAYLTGYTDSTNFDTVGPIQGDSAGYDAFASKLNPAGSALVYSTYLGGDGDDYALGIAVDSSGDAYLAGSTGSTDFPTKDPIEGDSGGTDAFVTELNAAGSKLLASTYLGGSDSDQAAGIAVDPKHSIYVAGSTRSTDYDTVGPIEGDSAGQDAFVSKLSLVPETTITKAPKKRIHTSDAKVTVKFKFRSSEPNSTFQCKLDHSRYKRCDSPYAKQVDHGKHKFSVRAKDSDGNLDPTPAHASFKVSGH
jgi:hypothetical protein